MKPTSKKEVKKVPAKSVSCSGSDALYDHPKIYLNIPEGKNEIECPYCSKLFQYSKKSKK